MAADALRYVFKISSKTDGGGYAPPEQDQWGDLPPQAQPQAQEAQAHGVETAEEGEQEHVPLRQYFEERWQEQAPPDDSWIDRWQENARANNRTRSTFIDTMLGIEQARRERHADPEGDIRARLPQSLQFPTRNEAIAENAPEPRHLEFLRDFAREAVGYPPNENSRFSEALGFFRDYQGHGDITQFCTDPEEVLNAGERYDTQLPVLAFYDKLVRADEEELGSKYLDSYDALFDVNGEDFRQQQQRRLKRKVFLETAGTYSVEDLRAVEETRKPLLGHIRSTAREIEQFMSQSIAELVPRRTAAPTTHEGVLNMKYLPQIVVNIRSGLPKPGIYRDITHVAHEKIEIIGGKDFIISLDVSGSMGTTSPIDDKPDIEQMPGEPEQEDDAPANAAGGNHETRFIERVIDWLERRNRKKPAASSEGDSPPFTPPAPHDDTAVVARNAAIEATEGIDQVQAVIDKFERAHGLKPGERKFRTSIIGFGFVGTVTQSAARLRPREFRRRVNDGYRQLVGVEQSDEKLNALFEDQRQARVVKPMRTELTTMDKIQIHKMWEYNAGAGGGTPADEAIELAIQQAEESVSQGRRPVYIHVTDGSSNSPGRDRLLLARLRQVGASVNCVVIKAGIRAALMSGFTEEEIFVVDDEAILPEVIKGIQLQEVKSSIRQSLGLTT